MLWSYLITQATLKNNDDSLQNVLVKRNRTFDYLKTISTVLSNSTQTDLNCFSNFHLVNT